jgi:hypothetical protein
MRIEPKIVEATIMSPAVRAAVATVEKAFGASTAAARRAGIIAIINTNSCIPQMYVFSCGQARACQVSGNHLL